MLTRLVRLWGVAIVAASEVHAAMRTAATQCNDKEQYVSMVKEIALKDFNERAAAAAEAQASS